MSVTSANCMKETGQWTRTGRTYTRVFKVVCDDLETTTVAILGDASMPDLGDQHPDDSTARCTKLGPPVQDGNMAAPTWHVPVYYERPTESTLEVNPLDEKPKVTWTEGSFQEAIERDRNGGNVLNSAKDWFDPPYVMDRYYAEVTISRNEATYNPVLAQTYRGAVNSTACTIAKVPAAARHAKLVQWSGDERTRNNVDYWRVTYCIQFKAYSSPVSTAEGWDAELLDQGLNDYVGGKKNRMKDDDEKQDVVTPQRLNGSGAKLAHASTNVYMPFRVRDELNFNTLGLNI